ncbi:hypothetical protein HY500_03305 [Candidatus Woesearchaeota archaeon]|nr:hypothetical protein [Candidatus Woesearchaeota archaeon]
MIWKDSLVFLCGSITGGIIGGLSKDIFLSDTKSGWWGRWVLIALLSTILVMQLVIYYKQKIDTKKDQKESRRSMG